MIPLPINNFSVQNTEHGRQYGNNTLYYYQEKTLTFEQLWQNSRRAATHLREQGICPRQKVLFSLQDSLEWPVLFHALVMIGAIPVITNPRLAVEDLQNIHKKSQCDLVIADKSVVEKFGTDINTIAFQDIDYSTCSMMESNFYNYQPHDIFVILTSSGTTNKYKLIVHEHDNIESGIRMDNPYDIYPNNTVCCPARMSFAYGLILNVLGPLIYGYKVIILDMPKDIRNIGTIVNQHGATHLFLGPYLTKILIKHSGIKFNNHLTNVYTSGEPTSIELNRSFKEKFNVNLHEIYGSAETLRLGLMVNKPEDYCELSLGRPIIGVDIKVVGTDGQELEPNNVGEFLIRCSTLPQQYYNDPVLTKQAFKDGWYWTNDLGYQDQNGRYFFVGRVGQYVKISSFYVSTTDIETELIKVPQVADCTVVFEKNQNGITTSIAFVTLQDTINDITALDIKKSLIKNNVPSHIIPKDLQIVNNLPLTVTNKKIRSLSTIQQNVIKL